MKETNSFNMTAKGKKYLGSEYKEEICDKSLEDTFQFHHVRKPQNNNASLRKKKTSAKIGDYDMRRQPGESTIVLERSPQNENALLTSGSKMFHHKKLSVGNLSVLESLKNLSASFEMGLSSHRKGKSSMGGKLGLSATSQMLQK